MRQFLYYISDNPKEKNIIADKNKLKDADLAKEKTALDDVASKLYKTDVGMNYHTGRIYRGLTLGSDINVVINYIAT